MSVKEKLNRQGIKEAINKEAKFISKQKEADNINPIATKKNRKGRGRPFEGGKNPTINVSLNSQQLARFERYCEDKGFSLSGGIRAIIIEKMKREGY